MEKTARCRVIYRDGHFETDNLYIVSPTGHGLSLGLHKKIPGECWPAVRSIREKVIEVRKARNTYKITHREELKIGSDSRPATLCYMRDTFGGPFEELVNLTYEEMRLFKKAVEAR